MLRQNPLGGVGAASALDQPARADRHCSGCPALGGPVCARGPSECGKPIGSTPLAATPIEAAAVWELMGIVPEQEALKLGTALLNGETLPLLGITRQLFDRGYEPNAILQALTTLLWDLLVVALAADGRALTTISPASWEKATHLAQQFGRDQLLRLWQSLKGTEPQLCHSSQPRLTPEVLLPGLLAEPMPAVTSPSVRGPPPQPRAIPVHTARRSRICPRHQHQHISPHQQLHHRKPPPRPRPRSLK